ncbi:hypothetical protein [Clostridium beijerinckii]|uniref:IS605 OrfB family transposase n=3 Tax=Clostridium beijerinckii TaxID=1520 RepID=A0A9Q5GPR2_CLOBE|nr:hypothetical protein [Clostridium beijerinckii]AQS04999.1 hypothetical protein CLBIJ_24290 [Clostridium beijerinckii]MBA2885984.1 IS605 OrfB family transposase [Clostridium beijerinckii]MBA2900727.1 IS605 OrfB family transposase [Clostridium beijerinckii]MBA2910543.1 IS605 OrfB family transposase [Clostridium beijerinckii]MBA9015435.1 IS605 OrfB family transposase [Clostridium beijerinckii]
MNIVKKIKIIINNPDNEIRKNQYRFIRNSQYAQYQGLNRCMGYLVSGYYSSNMDLNCEKFKEHQRKLTNSSSIFQDIIFGKGIDSKSNILQRVRNDFKNAIKNGLASGDRNVSNYRRTFPLMTRGRNLNFVYDENEKDILINWVNKIQFKCILGENKNLREVKSILDKVINKEYSVSQSLMYFNNKNELILLLTLNIQIEIEKYAPVKDRVLEIDFGREVPVYMSINDKPYIKKLLGDFSELNRVRLQFKARRQRLYKQLEFSKGGRGKKDKFISIEEFREKQRNFIKTYNHFLSKSIVEFALKHRCEYIYLKKLDKDRESKLPLYNWNYHELEEKIIYKAERKGIKIKKRDSLDMCDKFNENEYVN